MVLVKRSYIAMMHAIGGFGPTKPLFAAAEESDPYGWRRWFASLLAIYDIRKMAELGLPWWNVAATREVERFLAARRNARVFEYGAGASTAWLAKRAHEVLTVEHDAAFMGEFRKMLAPLANVALLERPIVDGGASYVGAISEVGGHFDLVVVDGRHRADCLMAAIPHLKPGGIVLFDDSGRKRYRGAIAHSGLSESHYFGRSFCVPYPDHTSILHHA
ncbi:MAG: class I SAM-dependent methyltransferase [Novosphingobium sp.]|nr:class I SAM-dependent methyltransferase [Novosphingobium sp.]